MPTTGLKSHITPCDTRMSHARVPLIDVGSLDFDVRWIQAEGVPPPSLSDAGGKYSALSRSGLSDVAGWSQSKRQGAIVLRTMPYFLS